MCKSDETFELFNQKIAINWILLNVLHINPCFIFNHAILTSLSNPRMSLTYVASHFSIFNLNIEHFYLFSLFFGLLTFDRSRISTSSKKMRHFIMIILCASLAIADLTISDQDEWVKFIKVLRKFRFINQLKMKMNYSFFYRLICYSPITCAIYNGKFGMRLEVEVKVHNFNENKLLFQIMKKLSKNWSATVLTS